MSLWHLPDPNYSFLHDPGVFHTEEIGPALRTAQVLGITTTAFLCGKTFSQSYIITPSLLLAPAPLLAKQWVKMVERDKLFAPTVVVFGASVFGYLARREPAFTTPRLLYLTSSTLLVCSIGYSILNLHPLNEKLKSKTASISAKGQEDAGIQREDTVHFLVDQWALWNLGRSAIVGIAALLATWASVEKLVIREFKVIEGGVQMGRL